MDHRLIGESGYQNPHGEVQIRRARVLPADWQSLFNKALTALFVRATPIGRLGQRSSAGETLVVVSPFVLI
jgi:hypothetical protein